MTVPQQSPAAVIHDVRYSRFEGQLQSRGAAVAALARSSAGRALGIRRSTGAKLWPFLLIAVIFAPPLVAVLVPVLRQPEPEEHPGSVRHPELAVVGAGTLVSDTER